MADYRLGLGDTPTLTGGGMIENPAYPGGSSAGMGTGIPQSPPPSQTENPDLGLGTTPPSPSPTPNGGATGSAGGGSFTPGQGLNWQGASPADLYGQFQSLDPGLQQSYINYYMNNLDPTQQANWRQAFGQDQPALGAANPQMSSAPPGPQIGSYSSVGNGYGGDFGMPPPGGQGNYSALMGDATNYYLSHGGTQQNVDAYTAAHPGQSYAQLAGDAAQWYAGSGVAGRDQRNQDIGGYFGLSAPPAGQDYNYGPGAQYVPQQKPGIGGRIADPSMAIHAQQPGPSGTPGLGSINGAGLGALGNVSTPYTGAYPQSWIDMYNRQSAGTQTAMRDRFSGLSPDQITQDWNNNIQPNYANGTTPEQILSGAPTGASPPSTTGSIQGAGLGMSAPGNNNNAPGGRGSLANAQADPGDYWRQHKDDAFRAGANQGEYAPGSGVPGKDPWLAPSHQMNNGQTQYGKGYHAGQSYQSEPIKDPRTGQPLMVNGQPYTQTLGGGPIKWDQEEGPGKGYTEAGRQEMRQPFTIGGQTFQNGLKPFLNFMRTSSPREQALKGKLGSFDEAGGSLETGERTLFDTLAPYLAQGSLKMPASGTPFTDWNPVGLIDALRKSGLLT